jgi:hypothetical protein
MLSTKHPAASLTRGLPHAFRTPDGHFVPDHIRQSPNGMPAQIRLQKTFYRKDVESITAEVDEVNGFGDGAADEWRKGMAQRGKDAMADSSRWERWEGRSQKCSGSMISLPSLVFWTNSNISNVRQLANMHM